MINVKEYLTELTPTKKEIEQSIFICKNEHCVVHLRWFIQYSGWYDRYIREDDDPEKIYEILHNTIYGI
jgi:hypothetical protein